MEDMDDQQQQKMMQPGYSYVPSRSEMCGQTDGNYKTDGRPRMHAMHNTDLTPTLRSSHDDLL